MICTLATDPWRVLLPALPVSTAGTSLHFVYQPLAFSSPVNLYAADLGAVLQYAEQTGPAFYNLQQAHAPIASLSVTIPFTSLTPSSSKSMRTRKDTLPPKCIDRGIPRSTLQVVQRDGAADVLVLCLGGGFVVPRLEATIC